MTMSAIEKRIDWSGNSVAVIIRNGQGFRLLLAQIVSEDENRRHTQVSIQSREDFAKLVLPVLQYQQ